MHVFEFAYDTDEETRYSIQLSFVPRIGESLYLDWFGKSRMSGTVVAVQWHIEYSDSVSNENNQMVTITIVLRRDNSDATGTVGKVKE